MSDEERYGASIGDEYEESLGAPRKPRCTAAKRLCVPTADHRTPTGRLAWRHDATCPDQPLKLIHPREYVGAGRQRLGWRGLR